MRVVKSAGSRSTGSAPRGRSPLVAAGYVSTREPGPGSGPEPVSLPHPAALAASRAIAPSAATARRERWRSVIVGLLRDDAEAGVELDLDERAVAALHLDLVAVSALVGGLDLGDRARARGRERRRPCPVGRWPAHRGGGLARVVVAPAVIVPLAALAALASLLARGGRVRTLPARALPALGSRQRRASERERGDRRRDNSCRLEPVAHGVPPWLG